MTATTTFNAIPYPQLTDVKTIQPQFLAMSNQADSRYVARFANQSTLTAANPTPVAGTMAYLIQESLLVQHNGTAWLPWQFQRVVNKVNPESTTSTTLQPDDALLFFAEANSVYHVEVQIGYVCAVTANAVVFGWSFPSGTTITRGTFGLANSTNDRNNAIIGMVGIKNGDTRTVGSTGSTSYASYTESAIVRSGSTAGNVNFLWAQGTASATPTALLPSCSYLTYTKIS